MHIALNQQLLLWEYVQDPKEKINQTTPKKKELYGVPYQKTKKNKRKVRKKLKVKGKKPKKLDNFRNQSKNKTKSEHEKELKITKSTLSHNHAINLTQ